MGSVSGLAKLLRAVSILGLMSAALAAHASESLGPGSPAPKLSFKRWLKGEPIRQLEPQKLYVIDFWASWCGPCLESIPHLTEIAKQNPDVTVLGAGIWEDDGEDLAKFMQLKGDQMGYRVAYSGNKDGMAATWMQAAAQRGIPTAFIVKDRKILWIGHPLALDKPLDEIKRGTFDLPAFKKSFLQRAEKERQQMALDAEYSAILKLHEEGKREDAKKALDAFVAKHPEFAESADRVRYEWLASENLAAWRVKTEAMLATGALGDIKTVASFALRQAQRPEGADLARTAMRMALEANKKDEFEILLYARSVYLKLKDYREALTVTNRMIELHTETSGVDKSLLLKSKAELEAKLAGG